MFQTDLILFLQSFETDFLNHFFQFWSDVGFSRWTWFFMLVFLFGISFRYGFVLMQALMLNGLVSLWLKELFALPRPAYVDLNVKLIGGSAPNMTPFESQGAGTFFGGLPKDVVTSLRANPPGSWGFPSGHSSNATVMGGLFSLIFKKTWVRVISVAIVVLVPLSRMYLGRHFLADILGGYIVGLAFVFLFYAGVVKNDQLFSFLICKPPRLRWEIRTTLFFFYMCFFPCVLLFVPKINLEVVASLLGLNIGFLLVWNRGVPEEGGTIRQRMARVLVAIGVFMLADLTMEGASRLLFHPVPAGVAFIKNSVPVLLCVWGATELSIKFKFYKRQPH